MDDPDRRRVTRQSTRRVEPAGPKPTTNPYKKPTYIPSSDSNSNDSASSKTRQEPAAKRGRGRGKSTPVKRPAPGSGSASASSAKKGSAKKKRRPECITSRSKSKKKKKRKSYYNTTDYHYGSDFDEEDDGDEEDDDEEEDEEEDDAEDSQDALLLEDLEEDDATNNITTALLPPPPLYIEVEPTEILILPKSSEDLLIEKDLIIQAVGVYEPLRRFSGLVRLTQFRFEDFCAALAAVDEQSVLLIEIHAQLLKALLREDDSLTSSFGPPEVKDSIQSVLYFNDQLTWPSALRYYLESDPAWASANSLLKNVDYPFCSVQTRLRLLTFLVDQFLSTGLVRDALASEIIKHEDHCRACTRLGELICCESCPAVYHLECIDPPLKDAGELVPDEWKCVVCKRDELTGTGDCVSELERAGLLIRQEKLGYDRHGRKYWFIVRRVIVESDSQCWYYTTKQQLAELMYCLEDESYEVNLLRTLRYHQDEIERQMDVTEELTILASQHRRTWLDIENAALAQLNTERGLIIEQEKAERAQKLEEEAARVLKIEEDRLKAEEEVKKKEEDEKRRIREERLAKRNNEKAKQVDELDLAAINDLIRDQEMAEEAKTDQLTEDQTETKPSSPPKPEPTEPRPESPISKPTTKQTLTTLISTDLERMTRLKSTPFKLGQDNTHKHYTNCYSSDPLALSKAQHQEERDRKRYTSHKFSLTTASDFKWIGSTNGNKAQLATTFKSTLMTLEALLPSSLLHVNWAVERKLWLTKVQSGRAMGELLMTLAEAMRGCLFNSVWFEGAGHAKLVRVSGSEREERKKWEKAEKKWKDDEEERFKSRGVVKYTIPLKHQVFKQKGEEYRIHGQYGWIWRSSIRPAKAIASSNLGLKAGPQKHVIQVKGEDGVVKTMLIDPNVFNKLMAKRIPSETCRINYDQVRIGSSTVKYSDYIAGKVTQLELDVQETVQDILQTLEPPIDKEETVINVSKGLVLANRIQYPKIAKKSEICDSILSQRQRLQSIEDKLMAKKYGPRLSCYCQSCPKECYSPTCLNVLIEKERTYKISTSPAVSLKKEEGLKTSKITKRQYQTSKGRSLLVLPTWELRKLARSSGRIYCPAGFQSSKGWGAYPCGRPNFRTAWGYRTMVGGWSLACLGMQLRILWACVRWDDLQMKPPMEGKSLITTDTEIITNEILSHRIRGRFSEKVQYLRKRHIVPIDASPVKTVVVKDPISTPSRHGLRKRKRLLSPSGSDPTITEEWVNEEKLELWEIRYYGERKLNEKSTRSKTGVQLSRPEKYDPSPSPSPHVYQKRTEIKQEEALDSKVAHVSKRDNHAKNVTNVTNVKSEPTASELLLMQQTVASKAFCTPTAANAFGGGLAGSVVGRKFFLSKAKESLKKVETAAPTTPTQSQPPATTAVATTPEQPSRLQVFRSEDGKLQIRGLLPGQHCYQTADGRIHIVGSPDLGKPTRLQAPTPQILRGNVQQQVLRGLVTPQKAQNPGVVRTQMLLASQAVRQAASPSTPRQVTASSLVQASQGLGQLQVQQGQVQVPQFQTVQVQPAQTASALVQSPQQLQPTQQKPPLVTPTQPQTTQILITTPGSTTPQQVYVTMNPQQLFIRSPAVYARKTRTVLSTDVPTILNPTLRMTTPRLIAGPRNLRPQVNQLPISIVSPSKQQFQLVSSGDGTFLQQGGVGLARPRQPILIRGDKKPAPTLLQTGLVAVPGSSVQTSQPSQVQVQLPSSVLQSQQQSPGPVKNLQFQNASPVQVQSPISGQIQLSQLQGQISPAQLQGLRQIITSQAQTGQTQFQIQLTPGINSTQVQLGPSTSTPIQVTSVANMGQIQLGVNNQIRQPQATGQNTTPRLIQITPGHNIGQVLPGRTQFQIVNPGQNTGQVRLAQGQVLTQISGQVPQPPGPRPLIVRKLVTSAQLAQLQQQGLIRSVPPAFVFRDGQQVVLRPQQQMVLPQARIMRPNSPNVVLASSGVAPQVVSAVQALQASPIVSPVQVPVRSPPVISLPPIAATEPIVSPVKTPPAVLTSPLKTPSPRKSPVKMLVKTSPDTPEKPTVSSPVYEPPPIAGLSTPVLNLNKQRRKTSHAPAQMPTLSLAQKTLLFNRKEDLKADIMKKRALLEAKIHQELQKEREELLQPTPRKRKSTTPTESTPPKQEKPSCTCAQPITSTQFHVACEKCNQFFHGLCVGITRQMLNDGKVYTCEGCEVPEEVAKRGRGRKKSAGGGKKEIYCLCKEPYDDSHFYICCDKCQDWFHGRCVGVLPVEGQTILTYRCPTCHPTSPFNNANFKKLVPKDHAHLRTIMKLVLEMNEADDFYDPVDSKEHPTYRQAIREPMELRTMEQRVNQETYVRLADFVADACRIFDNCRHYNPATSAICKKATLLESVFVTNLRILRQKMISTRD